MSSATVSTLPFSPLPAAQPRHTLRTPLPGSGLLPFPDAQPRPRPDSAEKLRKRAARGEPVVLGSVADPYEPTARHNRGTHRVLLGLRSLAGLEVNITTRSPEILGNAELLAELDLQHAVTINLLLTAVDPFLVKRLDPQAPHPRASLETLRRLTARGLATRLQVPLAAGINNRGAVLDPLFRAAKEGGAFDVQAVACTHWPGGESHSWRHWRHGLLAGLGGAPTPLLRRNENEPWRMDFDRLRLQHGFPCARPGRG